jgi:hypothetical protein
MFGTKRRHSNKKRNLVQKFKQLTINKKIVLDLFLHIDFHVGGNRHYINNVITPYLIGFRQIAGVYNMNILMYN